LDLVEEVVIVWDATTGNGMCDVCARNLFSTGDFCGNVQLMGHNMMIEHESSYLWRMRMVCMLSPTKWKTTHTH